jgi:hypothetical protein
MDARRNSENNASAAHEAIFSATFVPLTSKDEPPDVFSPRAELKSDSDFVLWHSSNGAHIRNLFGGSEIGPGVG